VRRRCQRINSVQRIQKSEEERALAQEFKRVYWRESKRKYRCQVSEQEREDAVNTNLDYQKIPKSEKERVLALEFKRVYWRESKRKYRSQLSEQEREATVNVSTPFQIAKARLSSAYYCNQKQTLITKKIRKVKKNKCLPWSLRECIGGNPKESIVLNLVSKREKTLSMHQLCSK